jgi:hypothetical protein
VAVDGSAPPVALADWDNNWTPWFTWLEDGDLLIPSDNGTKFFRLPTNGGPAKPAVKIDTGPVSGGATFSGRLPGDRGVFFGMESWGPRGYQLDEWLLDPKTGKAQRLFERAGSATYVPTGHIVFTRGETLMAVPFDLERLAATGEVTALSGGVRTPNSWDNGRIALSNDGTLIYVPGGRVGADRRLVTVDLAGRVTPFIDERRGYETPPAVARDGRRVAVVVPNTQGTYETWVADLDRPGLKRVLALPNADCAVPIWSPDGRRIAYRRTAIDADDGVYVQAVDGSGSPRAVLKVESKSVRLRPLSWTSDGSGLIVLKVADGKGDLLLVPVTTGGEPGTPRVLRATPYDEAAAAFSPDGHLLAFRSDESGQYELYVSSYGADGAVGAPVLVSSGGAGSFSWAGDSKRLVYGGLTDRLMAVTIEAKPALRSSVPVATYDLKQLRVTAGEWGLLPDGRLLAIQRGEGEDDITSFNVVLNWFDELRERMTKAGRK